MHNEDRYAAILDPEALRPLLRLHQIAMDIRNAITREDYDVMRKAARLLPSALANWEEVYNALPISPGESVQIAIDTQRILSDCEVLLTKAMGRVAREMRRLRGGQRTVAYVNSIPNGVSRENKAISEFYR